jgi:hypothetical protein
MKKTSLALSVPVIMALLLSEALASIVAGQGQFSVAASNFPAAIERGKEYPVYLKLTPKPSANQAPFDYVCKLEQKMPLGWVTVATVTRRTSGPWTQPITVSSGFKVPYYHVGGITMRWNVNGKPFDKVLVNLVQEKYSTNSVNIPMR